MIEQWFAPSFPPIFVDEILLLPSQILLCLLLTAERCFFWSMGHILETTVLLQLLETPCSPHHSLLTLLDLLTFLFLLRLGCHLGRTDMDPSHVVSGCCGVGLDPNACQIECQKECQIECQNKCQIECQIEGQSMCQIECQLVGITRRM